MVEVETVGDPPDVPEGPERQRPRQPGPGSDHHRQDHRRGGSGHQQEPPVVEEGPLAAHGMERPQHGDGSDGPEESDDPARRADATGTAGGAARAGLGALPDPASVFSPVVPGPVPGDADATGDTGDGHGQQGAGHDLLDPGVGAVVEAGDAHSVVQEQGGHRGREDDPEGRHHGQAPAPPPAQHEQGEGRPDQVELLLDGERPGMEERGGWPEPDEVVLPGEDEPPVRHIGQRGEGVTPEGAQRAGQGEPVGVGRDEQHGQEQRRQQPPGAPLVEVPEPHPSGRGPLPDQQGGDQEAGQDEEDVHAEQAAPGPRHATVEGEDPEDGHGTDPVETRDVGSGAPAGPTVLGQQIRVAGRGRGLRPGAGSEIHGRHG